jgi:hypothetical protein
MGTRLSVSTSIELVLGPRRKILLLPTKEAPSSDEASPVNRGRGLRLTSPCRSPQ